MIFRSIPPGVSGGPFGLGLSSTCVASACARGLGYGLWPCFGMQNTVRAMLPRRGCEMPNRAFFAGNERRSCAC